MCGIVGFIGRDAPPAGSPDALRGMLGALRHRGPDESGVYFDAEVGLGSARLSIIDLESGTQPIGSVDGRWWIVFNGEIYNYVELRAELERAGCSFRTRSDTEVLLNALVTWGGKALDRLDGQFAFALYDRRERNLLLARDPFGERPLFYTGLGTGLAFASEIKALFVLPEVERSLSLEGLHRVYRLWTDFDGGTCFAGVKSLPPGHLLMRSAKGTTVRPYYRLPIGAEPLATGMEEACDAVVEALSLSTERRLRSDVEVACYLSGGLDSTITAGLARAKSGRKVRAFSIAFEDAAFDESAFQQTASRYLDVDAHAIRVSNRDIAETFPDVIRHAETALFRTAPAPMFCLARAVRAAGIKVVMTGEGADEAFLGYDLFKETLFRLRYAEYPDNAARIDALRSMYSYLPHFSAASAGPLLRFFSQFLQEKHPGLYSHEARFSNGLFSERLLTPDRGCEDPPAALSRFVHGLYPEFSGATALERAQVLEYLTLLAGYLLSSQGDRMTAAHGVEGRCPFLDRNVVDLAFRLPQDLRLDASLNEKLVLKEAFADRLPPEIAKRPKQPYRAPDALPFLGAGRPEWVAELLSPSRIATAGVFDETQTRALLGRMANARAGQISPREDQAVVLLLSTLLLDEFFVRGPRPSGQSVTLDRLVDGSALKP